MPKGEYGQSEEILRQTHILRAMNVLCNFFESKTYKDIINNDPHFFDGQDILIAASALYIAQSIEEDIGYSLKSYVILFTTSTTRIKLKDLDEMVRFMLKALDYNISLTTTDYEFWDRIVANKGFT